MPRHLLEKAGTLEPRISLLDEEEVERAIADAEAEAAAAAEEAAQAQEQLQAAAAAGEQRGGREREAGYGREERDRSRERERARDRDRCGDEGTWCAFGHAGCVQLGWVVGFADHKIRSSLAVQPALRGYRDTGLICGLRLISSASVRVLHL